LGQVQRIIADRIEDQILQFVDNTQELLSKCRHGCGGLFDRRAQDARLLLARDNCGARVMWLSKLARKSW
jgi:hypothetical protein